MQRWVEEGRSRNPEVELVRFVNLPVPDLIDPICDLITDTELGCFMTCFASGSE